MKSKRVFIGFIVSLALTSAFVLFSIFNKTSSDEDYKVITLSQNDYKGGNLEQWKNSCIEKDGYYELISFGPDSWDLYIYYPVANDQLRHIRYIPVLMYVEKTMKVFLSPINTGDEDEITKDLMINVKGPKRGPWPIKSELFNDGTEVKCIGKKIDN